MRGKVKRNRQWDLSSVQKPLHISTKFSETNIIGFARCYPKIILKEEKVSETAVPVHYHSSFSQAHEFLLGSQVSLIEAAVSPVANKENPSSVQTFWAAQDRTSERYYLALSNNFMVRLRKK